MRHFLPVLLSLAMACAVFAAISSAEDPSPDGTNRFTATSSSGDPSPDGTNRFTDAAYAAHVEKLKKRLPHDGFTVLIEKPFVVIGDEPEASVRRWAKHTVKWAADRLKESFFSKDPIHILDVWLFKDKESYEKHVKQLFGSEPSTPFGYYSSTDRALVMNISTGGGTLVHEIVHPFVEANVTDCPAWFNEGLGSLYEQCKDKDGKIWGLTNWRLAGLQKAIREDRVPSFEKLTSMSDHEFYNLDKGTNYAQARYLLYYLQEKGLLRKYYGRFMEKRPKDPTGFATLEEILEEADMDAFQKRWSGFVLKLRFR